MFPAQYRPLAFVDMEIPIGHGEVMLAPKLEARLLQELTLKKTDRVLEVGTGSGYVTALLAALGGPCLQRRDAPRPVGRLRRQSLPLTGSTM